MEVRHGARLIAEALANAHLTTHRTARHGTAWRITYMICGTWFAWNLESGIWTFVYILNFKIEIRIWNV